MVPHQILVINDLRESVPENICYCFKDEVRRGLDMKVGFTKLQFQLSSPNVLIVKR